jgi:hypothetical protein
MLSHQQKYKENMAMWPQTVVIVQCIYVFQIPKAEPLYVDRAKAYK